MLVNLVHGTRAEHRKLLVAGIGFTIVLALLIAGSVAIYQKVFTPVTMVTVQADRAGLQLAKFGDVRLHGALVGQVRSVEQDGEQAVIRIGLDPDEAKDIPDNISVQILPTTLFGQKYVNLVDPATPSTTMVSDDTVIPASRVETNVELSQALSTLFPLLRSIRPADLNATLYALASALEGRGEELGQTIEQLDSYLAAVNKEMPTLRRDLALLADVTKTYDVAAPDLIKALENATTTARTVTAREKQLRSFFTSMTKLSKVGTAVLKENGDALVQELRLARPLTRLLDTYSPEYTCLLEGVDRYTGRLATIFRTGRVFQSMSFDAIQRPAYGVEDRPAYGEVGHGPWCLGLPDKPPVPFPAAPLKNGSHLDEPGRH